MEKMLTVKVTPQDGSWQSALPLIKAIEETPDIEKLADKLHVEVEDVHSNKRSINTSCVFNNGQIQNVAPVVNQNFR